MKHSDPIKKNHVQVAGRIDAEHTLVFVHGFGTDQSAWHGLVDWFAADFRLVLLDSVGAGQSDPEAFVQHQYLNLQAYAEDLLAVCSAVGGEGRPLTLVGHSAGAMACVLAAIQQPERFDRLVLIGASPRYLNDGRYQGGFTQEDLSQVYSQVLGDYDGWVERFAPRTMANPDRPALARRFADTLRTIPANRVLTVLCSILQSDHRPDLARLSVPTLLIQSQDDVFVPLAVAEFMHRQISHSQLKIIAATGHLPHVSAPAQVAAAMREFLGETLEAGCH